MALLLPKIVGNKCCRALRDQAGCMQHAIFVSFVCTVSTSLYTIHVISAMHKELSLSSRLRQGACSTRLCPLCFACTVSTSLFTIHVMSAMHKELSLSSRPRQCLCTSGHQTEKFCFGFSTHLTPTSQPKNVMLFDSTTWRQNRRSSVFPQRDEA